MNKKGFLFTITTLLLLFSLLLLAMVYLDRNKGLQNTVNLLSAGDKLRYVEDDIVSNAYHELLTISLNDITRSSTLNVSFNQSLLVSGRNYAILMNDYKTFIEGTYSSLNNLDITLENFNNNFTIEPHDTIFEMQGENLYLYTMPTSSNPVQSIYITMDVAAENNSDCMQPNEDTGNPHYSQITVTYIYTGGSCSKSVLLNPDENNDAVGSQFLLNTKNPSGSIEIKYGQITGMSGNGILAVLTSNISANVSQLDTIYDLASDKVKIKGGNISITSAVGNITKETEVIIAEE